jgi:hypothetical protein
MLMFHVPALQTLVAHVDVSHAGKMPALQMLVAHVDVSRAGKMPALQRSCVMQLATGRQDAGAPDVTGAC